jgi:hypothetical protein
VSKKQNKKKKKSGFASEALLVKCWLTCNELQRTLHDVCLLGLLARHSFPRSNSSQRYLLAHLRIVLTSFKKSRCLDSSSQGSAPSGKDGFAFVLENSTEISLSIIRFEEGVRLL